MNTISINPAHIASAARYLLTLDQFAIQKNYQSDWPQVKLRLQELLDSYSHPHYLSGETMIDQFHRSLNHLYESTHSLTQQLTAETQLHLKIYLQRFPKI